MDLVTCRCAKCKAKLGTPTNLWVQIGTKYLALVPNEEDEEAFELSISTAGSSRLGEARTVVGGCKLVDAKCASCDADLGLRCLKTPRSHALVDGQFILRTTSLLMESVVGHRLVEPRIKYSLNLKGAMTYGDIFAPDEELEEAFTDFITYDQSATGTTTDGADYNINTDVAKLRADLKEQRKEITRIDTAGFKVVSSLKQHISRVEQQVLDVQKSVESLRRDDSTPKISKALSISEIASIKREIEKSPVIFRLDQQARTTDRVVAELRQGASKHKSEVAALREELSTALKTMYQTNEENCQLKRELKEMTKLARDCLDTSRGQTSELSSLRNEVKALRAELQLSDVRSKVLNDSSYSSHEHDIPSNNLAKIDNRASQAQSLKMESQLLESSVQRLEARSRSPTTDYDGQARPDSNSPRGQKRLWTNENDGGVFGSCTPTPKRKATATPDHTQDWPPSSPMGVDLVVMGSPSPRSPRLV